MRLFHSKDYQKKAEENEALKNEIRKLKSREVKVEGKDIKVSSAPSSVRDLPHDFMSGLKASLRVIDADFDYSIIPIIRKLAKVNPNVNQALNDFIKLANNGHKIIFDDSVKADDMVKARDFLNDSSKSWHVGAAGINGIVNKMFRQIQIAGALSTEWVPNLALDNLEEVRFVNPENIRFVADGRLKKYHPYQKVTNKLLPQTSNSLGLKKLNTNQYKYFSLNGDTDLPYGIPPYIAALEPISTQRKMLDNINYVVEIMGILGYMDAKMDKPLQDADESEEVYRARLTQLLTDLKSRVQGGMRDGVNVGFIDDHEFEFQQTTTNATGVKDLFEQNELLIASGLNYDAIFMGKPGSTETLVTVMFSKMISQLTNVQNIVKENLEFGYKLALELNGIKFKSLSVQFNKSTVTDTLKYQQAQEILTRNLETHYKYGLISLQQFSDLLGYESPDQSEPRILLEGSPDALAEAAKKQDKEKGKDASDKKSRDKNNPRGTVKKQNGSEFRLNDNILELNN